ncbi:hypothetical protein FNF29_03653 [Cafeteria roenbergensis]|uniref:Chorein N-terminal domain-containing protein n=1 Tax=Cafeteria roenbergensis TaxID=33653 RepID=A0A5A8CID3_CAFRO|nr:hypothetical protein FNF29_03653 [Cafeteria roenbergensis]|eukprot:KAA0152766.1 hypothetical protein FNF29_03653 [Cafeteria roenbergensis]
MAFNNTTGVPSPSPLSPSPSASPSVNVTLVNITRSELPLVLRPDDPAFPLYVAVWTAIACAVAVMCARGVQYIVGRFVQVMINCCMRLSRSKTRVRLDWAELSMLGGTLVLRGLSVQVPGAVVRIAKANIFVRYWMLGGGASSDAASPPPLAADLDGAEVFLVEAAGTYSRLQQLAAAQRTAKSGGRRGHRPPDTAANTSAAGAGSPADSAAQADAHLPSGVHAETDASGRVFAAADSAEAASVLRETAASTLGELMMLRPDRSRLSTASLLFSFVRVNVRSLRLVVGNHLLPSTAVMSAKDVALLSFVAGTGAAAPRGGGSPAHKRSATLDEAGRARSIVNTTARDVTLSIVRNPHFLHVRRTRAQVPSLPGSGRGGTAQGSGGGGGGRRVKRHRGRLFGHRAAALGTRDDDDDDADGVDGMSVGTDDDDDDDDYMVASGQGGGGGFDGDLDQGAAGEFAATFGPHHGARASSQAPSIRPWKLAAMASDASGRPAVDIAAEGAIPASIDSPAADSTASGPTAGDLEAGPTDDAFLADQTGAGDDAKPAKATGWGGGWFGGGRRDPLAQAVADARVFADRLADTSWDCPEPALAVVPRLRVLYVSEWHVQAGSAHRATPKAASAATAAGATAASLTSAEAAAADEADGAGGAAWQADESGPDRGLPGPDVSPEAALRGTASAGSSRSRGRRAARPPRAFRPSPLRSGLHIDVPPCGAAFGTPLGAPAGDASDDVSDTSPLRVSYGPWHERQRVLLSLFFAPPTFADATPSAPAKGALSHLDVLSGCPSTFALSVAVRRPVALDLPFTRNSAAGGEAIGRMVQEAISSSLGPWGRTAPSAALLQSGESGIDPHDFAAGVLEALAAQAEARDRVNDSTSAFSGLHGLGGAGFGSGTWPSHAAGATSAREAAFWAETALYVSIVSPTAEGIAAVAFPDGSGQDGGEGERERERGPPTSAARSRSQAGAQGAAPRPQACGTASTMHVLTGCARVAGGVQDDTVLVADGLTVESSALTPFRWEEPSLSTLSVSLLRPVWPLSYAHISAFTDLGVGFSAAMAATPTWLSQKELSRRSAGPATPAPAYFQPYSSVTVIRMDAPVLPLAAAPGNVVDTPGDLSETPTATLSLPCLVAQISMDLLEWGQPETAVRFDVLAGLPDPESGEVLCDAGNPMRPMSADTLDMAIGLDSADLTATPEAVSCLVHALINNILGGSQQPVTSLQAAMTGGQNLETYVTGRTSLVEPVGPAAATAAQAGSWVGRAQGPLRPADWRSGWTGMEVVARVDLRGVRAVVPTQHASDVADADPAGAAADQAFTSLLPEASSGAPVLAAAAPTVIVLCCPLVALQYRGATYGSELTLDVSPASVVLEGPDSGAAAQDDDFAPVQDGSLLLSLEEAQSVSGMAGKPPPSAGARLAQALARQRGRRRAAQRIVPPSPALTMAGAAGLPLLPSWVLQHFREGQVVSVSPKTLGIIVVAYHAGQVFVSAPVRDISSRSKIVLSQGESQAVVGSLTSSLHARTRRLQTGGPDGASLFVDPALLG